ncbi:MAG: protein-L-isoaspartate(D-aspartate) O-methyltransferase [Gammaproteobacteria bacterium]|nr:protein-L-isoaspartate(D-aspartate) O-methyltransferase [Gammaproteobacteria bacterium]
MDSPMMHGIGMTSRRTRERLVARLRERGIADPGVLDMISTLPRHLFVDEALASRAYEDTALPIGHGQTISQPYVVARMTEALLAGGGRRRVLEVGTGSGYQAAVLAGLVEQVYTVERIDALLRRARRCFRLLGLRNVRSRASDGNWGWPDYAPFDGIVVTAAPATVPEALLEQLALDGRLVAPVGAGAEQELILIERRPEGFVRASLGSVSFVPLRGGSE